MTTKQNKEQISVIFCRPGEVAEVVEIENDLELMQELVDGLIESYDPFYSETDPRYENVILVCNEEGKIRQMPPSRAIFDEDGRVMDVIAGPFFICYAPIESETFLSLPDDLKEEMRKKFDLPEHYYRSDEGLMVLKYDPKDLDREQAR